MEDEGRYKCAFCCQELAHSAYYRHLHDTSGTVCPGRSFCDGDATYKDLMPIADNGGHFNDVDEATMLEDKPDSSEFSFGSEDDASCGNNSLFDFGSADFENESVMMAGNLEPQYYDVSVHTCT